MTNSLLRNRFLLREFLVRDIHSRYLGSFMGLFWSFLNPLFQLLLYTAVFAGVLKTRFDGLPTTGGFAIFLFCALLPWIALHESTVRSAGVYLEHSNLIRKASFSLKSLPVSRVLSALFHQALGTTILLAVALWQGVLNLPWLWLLIPIVLFQFLLMYGIALAVASLNVFFRDIAHLLGVALMALFWMTPIVYPLSKVGSPYSWVLQANPLTHLVESYRFVFLSNPLPSWPGQAYWAAVAVAIFLLGRLIYQRSYAQVLDQA